MTLDLRTATAEQLAEWLVDNRHVKHSAIRWEFVEALSSDLNLIAAALPPGWVWGYYTEFGTWYANNHELNARVHVQSTGNEPSIAYVLLPWRGRLKSRRKPMPCDSSYLEATSIEVELSRVLCLLDELRTGVPVDPKSSRWRGYRADVYSTNPTRKRLDEAVAELCGELKKVPDVTKYSLEMQLWWRDHQRADAEREAKEKHGIGRVV